ncbi:MAG TPA: hypothetical protein VHH36_04970, partial [Candidatus Thermoplasmatota archaeon]|nr:hypothetical protein [Candidatus Thermoplasmatota archaeon]
VETVLGHEFVVVESPCGAADAADALVTRARVAEPWEARFHQAELEGRLGHIGRYWRRDASKPGWLLLGRHPGAPRVDLRGLRAHREEGDVAVHLFRHAGEPDRALLAVPRADAAARWTLAALDFTFPGAEEGALAVLHQRLSGGPLRSLLAREQMDLARRGFDKLVTPPDFALVYGADWEAAVGSVLDVALGRLRDGRLGRPEPRRAEDESSFTDYQRLLLDPRLSAVHARFLRPGEEAALVAQGETSIRRFVAQRRRATGHEAQHLLSMLEASLLARRGLARGGGVDPEVARQLRRLAYYL